MRTLYRLFKSRFFSLTRSKTKPKEASSGGPQDHPRRSRIHHGATAQTRTATQETARRTTGNRKAALGTTSSIPTTLGTASLVQTVLESNAVVIETSVRKVTEIRQRKPKTTIPNSQPEVRTVLEGWFVEVSFLSFKLGKVSARFGFISCLGGALKCCRGSFGACFLSDTCHEEDF